jgi:hypothetical protein
VLYATLVVFHFPFLNPYFYWFSKLGLSDEYSWDVFFQCFIVVASQCVGAGVAAVSSKDLPAYTEMHVDSNLGDLVSGKDMHPGFVFFEEFLAVCAFFMGVVYVLRCEVPEMLDNTLQKNAPIKAVMYVSVLVAGLSRAFPSAHFGLHVSVFMLARGVGSAWFRVLGGCVGTLFSIVCFRVWWDFNKRQADKNESLLDKKPADSSARTERLFQKIARLR